MFVRIDLHDKNSCDRAVMHHGLKNELKKSEYMTH